MIFGSGRRSERDDSHGWAKSNDPPKAERLVDDQDSPFARAGECLILNGCPLMTMGGIKDAFFLTRKCKRNYNICSCNGFKMDPIIPPNGGNCQKMHQDELDSLPACQNTFVIHAIDCD